jgi:two-component sensor histidine kinase
MTGDAQAREAELAASRARIVQAADQERRRIGRDLHDGPQQRLVVLGHLLHLALRAMPGDPTEAQQLLEQAREHVAATQQELRELARGLHPTALAEHGLRTSLSSLGVNSPLPLRIGELPQRRLPDALEATIYFLGSEALTNAVRYAGASEVRVTVSLEGRELVAEIADDGRGGATVEGGTGLRGLRDRILTLGGTLEIDSPPGGGTTLRAIVPVAPWRTPRDPFLEFGHEGDEGLGEQGIQAVVEGRRTATVSLAREWDLEGGAPVAGQRLPVLDHTGRRRATVEVQQVDAIRFDELPEEDAIGRQEFYDGCADEIALLLDQPGWRLTGSEPMIVLRFRVVEDPGGQDPQA